HIPRNDTVVVPFFRKVFVIIERRFVSKIKSSFHVAFDGVLIRCERKEQFMETPYVFPCLNRSVDACILRECQHQGFAFVQYIYFLALCFRKLIGFPYAKAYHTNTEYRKYNGIQPYLPKAVFYVS